MSLEIESAELYHWPSQSKLAALAITIVVAGMLAAAKPEGWRVTAWSVGAAAAILGAVSTVLPEVPGALGRLGRPLALAWGVLFVAGAESEVQRMNFPNPRTGDPATL